jgi:hypothetical protein
MIRTEDNQVEGVAHTAKIIFLDLEKPLVEVSDTENSPATHLEPVPTAFARLVTALFRVQHLHHQTLA